MYIIQVYSGPSYLGLCEYTLWCWHNNERPGCALYPWSPIFDYTLSAGLGAGLWCWCVLNSTLGTLDSRCEDCQENRNTQGILGLWVYALEGNPLEDQALGPSPLGNQIMKSDRLQLEKSLKEEFRGIKDQISEWEDIHVTQFLSRKQRIEVVIATLQDLSPPQFQITNFSHPNWAI